MFKPQFSPLPELGEWSPAELASRFHRVPGMMFFDSAREPEGGGALSLIAVEPEWEVSGNLFKEADFQRLRDAVRELQSVGVRLDDGLPGRVLAGMVEYSGEFRFGVCERVLVYRHREGRWYGSGDWWRALPQAPVEPGMGGPLRFEPRMTRERFCEMVERAQDYIRSGDIYQVNLSHALEAVWPGGDPWAFYEALRHYSPAPYGAYLSFEDRVVLSSSPELFLKLSGRRICTRPIKGTRPRRSEAHADERSAYDLLTSPKEIAELVMITDLERNDLGRVCEWGSVAVRELLKLERYEQVFHLVSTVEGELRPEVDAVEALRACFPGGSITGAPKKRAREIIAELEGFPRGLYTGAIGWFGESGESAFNIAIRTVVVEKERAHFHVGAGIVAESDPEREWQETWDKAAGILLAAERCGAGAGKDRALPPRVGGVR